MDTPQHRKQLTRSLWAAAGAWSALACLGTASASPSDAPIPRLVDVTSSGVNVTPAQQQKLSAMQSASETQSGSLFGQIRQIRQKLSDLYRKYDFDVNCARRLNQDLNRIQGQLLDLRLSDQQQVRKILTPDQFTQLQSSIQKHPFPGDGHPPGGNDRDRREPHWDTH